MMCDWAMIITAVFDGLFWMGMLYIIWVFFK